MEQPRREEARERINHERGKKEGEEKEERAFPVPQRGRKLLDSSADRADRDPTREARARATRTEDKGRTGRYGNSPLISRTVVSL